MKGRPARLRAPPVIPGQDLADGSSAKHSATSGVFIRPAAPASSGGGSVPRSVLIRYTSCTKRSLSLRGVTIMHVVMQRQLAGHAQTTVRVHLQ